MEQNNPQIRSLFQPTGLKVREGEEGKESRTLEGCAIVFNTPTVLYEDDELVIREVILPSCAPQEFMNQQDVKLNLLHKRNDSLARSINGKGSLTIVTREDGVYFEAEAPACDLGDRALALVKNDTYTGCSFEFYEGDYDREQNTLPGGKVEIVYTHKTFRSVDALTIAMDPAYPTTTIAAREKETIKREKTTAEAEKAKLQEQKEAAKREAIRNLRAEAAKIFA